MAAVLVDDSPWASSRWSHLINIKRSQSSENVVTFSFRTYGKGSPKTPNAGDTELDVIEANVGSLEFTYVHTATMKLVNYFLGFLDLQQLAMKLAAWPEIRDTRTSLLGNYSLLVISLKMSVGNPYIIVPQSPSSDNYLIADLGRTSVTNSIFLQNTSTAPLISSIEVFVSHLQLSSSMAGQTHHIFEVPELPLEIFVPLKTVDTSIFPTAVGKVSIPSGKISLQAQQIPFILSLVKEQFIQEIPPPDEGDLLEFKKAMTGEEKTVSATVVQKEPKVVFDFDVAQLSLNLPHVPCNGSVQVSSTQTVETNKLVEYRICENANAVARGGHKPTRRCPCSFYF